MFHLQVDVVSPLLLNASLLLVLTTGYSDSLVQVTKYLAELCRPITDVQGRRYLRSAVRGLLHTPRYYLSTYGRRAFSYAGPSAWNSLPEHLRASDLSLNSFRHSLKTFCSHRWYMQHIRDFLVIVVGYTSLLFTFYIYIDRWRVWISVCHMLVMRQN